MANKADMLLRCRLADYVEDIMSLYVCFRRYAGALECPWCVTYLSFFPLRSAELLPCVGRLLCQGHKAALATQVRRSVGSLD